MSAVDPGSTTAPEPAPLGGIGKAILTLIRIAATVLTIGAVVAMKLVLRQNPAAALPVGLAIIAGIALFFGASKLAQVLAADARRETPSKGLGAAKLAVGGLVAAVAYLGVTLHPYKLGLVNASPFGWEATLPYAVAIALGAVGIGSGAMALRGQRLPGFAKFGLAGATLAAATLGPAAISTTRHLGTIRGSMATNFAINADGTRLVVVAPYLEGGHEAAVYRTNPVEFVREVTLTVDGYAADLTFSPDGQLLAVLETPTLSPRNATLRVENVDDGKALWSKPVSDLPGSSATLTFSRDGKQLLLGSSLSDSDDGEQAAVVVYDPMTGAEARRLALPGKRAGILSPDGERTAVASVEGARATIDILDVTSGERLATLDVTASREIEYGTRITWSDDGEKIVVGAGPALAAFETKTGKQLWLVDVSEGVEGRDAKDAAFAHDGERVVAAIDDERFWVLDATTGDVLQRVTNLPMYGAQWSADGTKMLTTDFSGNAGMTLWDVTAALE